MAKPLQLQLPMKTKTEEVLHDATLLFLNPLSVMQRIHEFNPMVFKNMFAYDLPGFWSGVSENDPRWAAVSWIQDVPLWQEKAIPIMIHGDGARFTEKNSNTLLCVQMKSMSTSGTFGLDILPFFSLPKAVRHTEDRVDLTSPNALAICGALPEFWTRRQAPRGRPRRAGLASWFCGERPCRDTFLPWAFPGALGADR